MAAKNLSRSAKFLFLINGLTQSLPMIALTAMINDIIQIPVDIIGVYGTMSFLPYSLKPFYSFILMKLNSQYARCCLLSFLFLLFGMSTICTAYVRDSVTFVIMGFLRGLSGSFSEFMVGLQLIREAKSFNYVSSKDNNNNNCGDDRDDISLCISNEDNSSFSYDERVSLFQAQAAKARSVGSSIGSIVPLIIFIFLDNEVNENVVSLIFFVAGIFPVISSFLVYKLQFGAVLVSHNNSSVSLSISHAIPGVDEHKFEVSEHFLDTANEMGGSSSKATQYQPSYQYSNRTDSSMKLHEVMFIVSFQLMLVTLFLKGLVEGSTIHIVLVWNVALIFAVLTLFSCYKLYKSKSWNILDPRISIFLALRQSIPGAGYQLASWHYYLMESKPLLLQISSCVGSFVSICSYGFYARYLSHMNISKVIIYTTLASACASLLYIWPVLLCDVDNVYRSFLILTLVGIVTVFFGELNFLPSVVLASQSVGRNGSYDVIVESSDIDNDGGALCQAECDNQDDDNGVEGGRCHANSKLEDLQYGTYISCVDFGDQIGLFLSIPLVSSLGIDRGSWSNLTYLILICALLQISSLLLLYLIPSKTAVKADDVNILSNRGCGE